MSIEQVQLLVTTVCSKACPDCCQRIPGKRPGAHEPWEAFERAAEFLRGHPLCICGGEATLHPDFPRMAREFKAMFDAPYMEVATNGARVVEHGVEVMGRFDLVRITGYADPVTQRAIAWAGLNLVGRHRVEPPGHIPLDQVGGGRPCGRERFIIHYAGRLYPCCVATGFDDTESIPLSADWRERIGTVPLLCTRCVFSL